MIFKKDIHITMLLYLTYYTLKLNPLNNSHILLTIRIHTKVVLHTRVCTSLNPTIIAYTAFWTYVGTPPTIGPCPWQL